MKKEDLENHVRITAPALRATKPEISKSMKPPVKSKLPVINRILFSSFTHTEISDIEIAQGLCALIGAFFKTSGMVGTFKLLEWLGFPIPDLDGKQALLNGWPVLNKRPRNCSAEVQSLIPRLEILEEMIEYK